MEQKTKQAKKHKFNISEFIPTGRENAITASELCKITGVDERQINYYIEKERQSGSPICAAQTKPQGFYKADNAAEMQGYVRSLKRRISTIRKTYKAVSQTASKMEQGSIKTY